MKTDLVILDYNDIIIDPNKADESFSKQMSALIEKAYGCNEKSLGILAIKNIPGFIEAKQRFLPKAYKLAHLPTTYLEESLTDKSSLYNAGWSHGKEKMGDIPDFAKGSFYFNPISDSPGAAEDRANYPVSYPCNVWPEESKIPDFEKEAKELGVLMKNTVVSLTKYIDHYAKEKIPFYEECMLFNLLKDTEKVKARLLYYFPVDKKEETKNPNASKEEIAKDSWIGWHNDSGFLTALAGEIYINDATGEILSKSPDPKSGLYILNRSGEEIHIQIPYDCMAVQLGECAQIITGGGLVATPHCVRGADQECAKNIRVARISEVCFIDTVPMYPLHVPKEITRDMVLDAGVKSERIPPLGSRWIDDGMTFGDFLQKTFDMYYNWSK